MSTATPEAPSSTERSSWAPMIALALAQVLMSFNVAALPVSLGGMVDDFDVPVTTVSTAIVMYGLFVAALVMAGAKLGQRFGWVRVFRVVVALFFAAEVMMVLSPGVGWVIAAQAAAGAAAAIIVPALVALIAENYRGSQQATAVGSLGSARAASGIGAFLIGGALGTYVGWRPVFALLAVLAVVVFVVSFRLRSDTADPSVDIDLVGAVLVGASIVMLTLGFNNLNNWGALSAGPDAPFSIAGVSPALALVVVGVALGQSFFVWTRRRSRGGKTPLVDLEVVESVHERSAVYAMFAIVLLEAAVNFTIPLYTQIVQGRTPLATSIAMMPFNLTVFVTALLVVRFYDRFTSRAIGRFSFGLTTVALVWLAFVVTNDWETVPTIVGLVVFGIGQGALVTLVFNVLVTSARSDQAGDVGSVRGTTQNLASAVGTALAGALLVALLTIGVGRAVTTSTLPESLRDQVNLDDVNFIGNDRLRTVLERTDATPEQVETAVDINVNARVDALRRGLLILAGVSLVALFPASRLPNYRASEIPDPAPPRRA